MTKLERAKIVLNFIRSKDAEYGSWDTWMVGTQTIKSRRIDTGDGWIASIMTPFSGIPKDTFTPHSYEELLMWQAAKSKSLANTLDLWADSLNKVLSLEFDENSARLINMRPGDWECLLGLPVPLKATRKPATREQIRRAYFEMH